MTIKNPTLEDLKNLDSGLHYWIRLEGEKDFTIGKLYLDAYEDGETYTDLIDGTERPCQSWWSFTLCGSEIDISDGHFGKVVEVDPRKITRG